MRPPEQNNKQKEEKTSPPVKAGGRSVAPPKSETGQKSAHAELTGFFAAAFEKHRHVRYVHNGAKDGAAAKAILAAIDLDEAKSLVTKYLTHEDTFYAKQGYTLAYMQTLLNALRQPSFGKPGATNGTFTNGKTPGVNHGKIYDDHKGLPGIRPPAANRRGPCVPTDSGVGGSAGATPPAGDGTDTSAVQASPPPPTDGRAGGG